jgi:hypothetical protein
MDSLWPLFLYWRDMRFGFKYWRRRVISNLGSLNIRRTLKIHTGPSPDWRHLP